MTAGRVNPRFRLEDQGILGLGKVHYNLMEPALVAASVQRGEGELGQGGTLLVSTGEFTGRSPKDKFTVRTPTTENTIWWDNNLAMSPEHFDQLHKDMPDHFTDTQLPLAAVLRFTALHLNNPLYNP